MTATIRLIFLAPVLAAATAVAPTVAKPAGASLQNCGSLSLGPGGDERGSTGGATCLLHAYQQHCRPAVYTLSFFGIDTVATDRFRLARANGSCLVNVTISFRIVPQPARHHTGVCRSLALRSAHVVAGHCTGAGIPASIVLDPKPQMP